MSGEINNREYRQKIIKELIAELHDGKSADDVKGKFAETFEGVSGAEISAAEQALISEGLPIEEVQRLCDVHSAVFRDVIQNEDHATPEHSVLGHPAHTLQEENRAIERLIEQEIKPKLEKYSGSDHHTVSESMITAIKKLLQINTHYLRKENLFFPYMEKHGITGPPKVMWGVDDEIRTSIKAAVSAAETGTDLIRTAEEAIERINEMIFKEENILLPMLSEHLTDGEWKKIADESGELGFCLIPEPPAWVPRAEEKPESSGDTLPLQGIILPSGIFSLTELTHMLDALPVDITFVDKDDTVKYFSQGSERVFPRTKAIIGRKVANCHPPASVHIVEEILEDFKHGRKDHEDFWINMAGKLVYIRYFAVRDENNEYLGTVEITQNIKPIQEITGEKRLVSD